MKVGGDGHQLRLRWARCVGGGKMGVGEERALLCLGLRTRGVSPCTTGACCGVREDLVNSLTPLLAPVCALRSAVFTISSSSHTNTGACACVRVRVSFCPSL